MSGTALDVILQPRLGARTSARRQRVTTGSDVVVWLDVRNDATGALVPGVTGVAAVYWLPGTREDESAAQPLLPVEAPPGTWRAVVPQTTPGTYVVWWMAAGQTAEIVFDVSSVGEVTLTSTGTIPWGDVQAVAAAAGASAAMPEARRVAAEVGGLAGADAGAIAGAPAGEAAGSAAAANLVAALPIQDIGAETAIPYVIVDMGQSTAFGTDPGGSKEVIQDGGGIWAVNQQTSGATAVVRAAFGVSPYNYEKSTGLRTSDPALACNNAGVHHANEIRRLRLIHPARPILIIPNTRGGASLAEWIAANGSDGVMWTNFLASLAVAQAWWTAQGYSGPLLFDIWRMAQGETDGTTQLPYNTEPTYKTGFIGLRGKMTALPNWRPQTVTLLHEMGRWGKLAVNGLAPTVARNQALRELAQELPLTALVPSYGLTTTGLADDQNHFDGPSHVERGIRGARLAAGMRLGYGERGLPRTKSGSADIRTPTINSSNEVRSLSQDELAGGGTLVVAGGTLSLPDPNVMISLDNIVHCWSRGAMAAGLPASILLPYQSNQTIVFDGVEVSQANLDLNCRYQLGLSRGSYRLTSIDPTKGNHLPRAETIPTGGQLGLAGSAAYDTAVQCLGGHVGLPGPAVGARAALIMRSTSGGTTKVGRSLNTVAVASGGTGYAVGDTITSDLNGAAGVGFAASVLTVGGNGAILTVRVTDWGCLLDAALAGPLGVMSTSGTGIGATFTPSVGNFGFYTARGDFVRSVTLSRIDAVLDLIGTPGGGANPGGWRILADTSESRTRIVAPVVNATTGVQAGDYLVINPATALASLPLSMPVTATEGDQVEIVFTKAITSLTWTGSVPINAPSAAAAGARLRYRFIAALGWV